MKGAVRFVRLIIKDLKDNLWTKGFLDEEKLFERVWILSCDDIFGDIILVSFDLQETNSSAIFYQIPSIDTLYVVFKSWPFSLSVTL